MRASPITHAPARWGAIGSLFTGWVVISLSGCSPAAPDDSKLPPDVQDPVALRTPAGALELYQGALPLLVQGVDEVMVWSAILTDELAGLPMPPGVAGPYTTFDSRQDLGGKGDLAYQRLHSARAQVREARGFLAAYYATDSATTATARELQGHLYALEGYADLFLADLFCSGIPLSTVHFDGDYTLAPGSSTRDVYRHAVALFDSALAFTTDSVRFQHLAAVGRGRALLALDSMAAATAAVMAVPTGYRYVVTSLVRSIREREIDRFISRSLSEGGNYSTTPGFPSVGAGEGNGLDYLSLSNRDPRAGGTRIGPDVLGHPMYFPTKYYPVGGTDIRTMAGGVEARLIDAEAALRLEAGSGAWLDALNALRTDGTFDTQLTPDPNDDPNAMDTLWHAGSGGVSGLRPLDNPGTVDGRVDLVFRERAFWLYLTAHRQGDLRRLIRYYSRAPDIVYPSGLYSGGSGAYGSEIVVPVPTQEQQFNPSYTGCIHRGA